MSNKIAFTIDLDDWYHTPLVAGANFSHYPSVETFFEKWDQRYDYVTEPCFRLLELLEKHEIRATFFVIADMVERYPRLMKTLKDSGHEIAHHSLHHTIPFHTKTKEQTQTGAQWEEELTAAKTILENYFEQPIIGYRAPGAYFADWMVEILIRNGFAYDSSVVSNSVYNKSNRPLSHFPTVPFFLNGNFEVAPTGDNAILEIPWTSREFGKWRLPGGGAFFFRLLGAHYFIKMYRQQLKKGDGVFYIHALDLSDETFPLSNFRHRPFYWVNKGKRTLQGLEKLLKAYPGKFCSCEEMLQKNHPAI